MDRRKTNEILRHAYKTNPYLSYNLEQFIIETIKKIKFVEPGIIEPINKKANTIFSTINDLLDDKCVIEGILTDYFLLGDSFVYAELNEKIACWDNFIVQNPDYIIVKRLAMGGEYEYFLRPDETLREKVLKNNLADLREIDERIFTHIKNGENIPLDKFYLSAFIRRKSPYDVRGTSAYQHFIDINSETLNIPEDLKYTLLVPNADLMQARTSEAAAMIKKWLTNKVFTPIAKLNDFYTVKDGEKVLILPSVNGSN